MPRKPMLKRESPPSGRRSRTHKADGFAEKGRLRHRPEVRDVAEHYGKVSASCKEIINQLKAYMLAAVKQIMEVLREEDPEGVLVEQKQKGFSFFTGLPEQRQGDYKNFRRFRAKETAAFLQASSSTR